VEAGFRPDDFTLTDDAGNLVTWSGLRGAPVVVFFYPRANTPGCTTESIAFSRLEPEFRAIGVRVIGASADSVKAQCSFKEKHALTVPLLSDPDKVVLTAWGVWGEKTLYGKTSMGIKRTTFLFDADGALVHVWNSVKVDGHAEKVLERARALVGG
jgi:peroxiredoxin Q/BCP